MTTAWSTRSICVEPEAEERRSLTANLRARRPSRETKSPYLVPATCTVFAWLLQFLLIYRKARAGELEQDSGLGQLARLTEVDVDEVGVTGAKHFFEAKVMSIFPPPGPSKSHDLRANYDISVKSNFRI